VCTVHVFRPGCSQQNVQFTWSCQVTEKRTAGHGWVTWPINRLVRQLSVIHSGSDFVWKTISGFFNKEVSFSTLDNIHKQQDAR
jgi:hypothetical protein